MNIFKRKRKLVSKLKNKEYREAFLSELITTGIPFQIKILREQRNWTQKQLGDRANMAQEAISRLEDPNYGKLSLKTLKSLASAFDVGLVVRFVPFSELINWEINLSQQSLEVLSFNQESYFKDEAIYPSINFQYFNLEIPATGQINIKKFMQKDSVGADKRYNLQRMSSNISNQTIALP